MIEDMLRSLFGLSPGEKRINQDIAKMRELTRLPAYDIIPWEKEGEMELFSLNITHQTKKDGMDKIRQGVIQSIYFEPMAVYAYKDYVKGTRESLLYCRTKEAEYIYRLLKNRTDIYFNGKLTASIDLNHVMVGHRSKQILCRITQDTYDWMGIRIGKELVAQVFDPTRPHASQQRAFSIYGKLAQEEKLIVQAAGFYALLTRWLGQKVKK